MIIHVDFEQSRTKEGNQIPQKDATLPQELEREAVIKRKLIQQCTQIGESVSKILESLENPH